MGFLRLIYVSIHFLITFIHHFHVVFSELLDRLKLKPAIYRWRAPVYNLGDNKDENCMMQNAGSELLRIGKLPTHVACLFAEKELNIDRIVTIIRWCAAAGVSCISLYDHQGLIASKIDTIRAKLKGLMEKSTYGLQLKSFVVHQGFVCVSQRESSSTDSVEVFLLSPKDGKPKFSEVVRQVAAHCDHLKINQCVVEECMDRLHPKEPELMFQFGSLLSNATLGYPPWYLRLTQMMRVPSHSRVRADHLGSAMLVYGGCQQRYGK